MPTKAPSLARLLAGASLVSLLTAACIAQDRGQESSARSPALPEGTVVQRDVAYVAGGQERQKLDLYLPQDGKDLPLIVNIHGGAFKTGSKEVGVPVTLYTVKGAGHGRFEDPKVPELTRDFLAKHLKPAAGR